jgi:hypothetical protein
MLGTNNAESTSRHSWFDLTAAPVIFQRNYLDKLHQAETLRQTKTIPAPAVGNPPLLTEAKSRG